MLHDEDFSIPSQSPSIAVPAEPLSQEPHGVPFLVVLRNGVVWAVVLGGLAYLYGWYGVATGTSGIAPLIVLAAVCLGLVVRFWALPRSAALVRYEAGAAAVWIGYFSGSVSLSSLVDGQWFFLFFVAWLISSLLGGGLPSGT